MSSSRHRPNLLHDDASLLTYGLTHIALAVKDPVRSFGFYQQVLGLIAVYESDDFIQAQTPGARDVLVFERRSRSVGRMDGVLHFGFRVRRPADIEVAAAAIRAAGGRITEQGEFVPGEPYVFFTDPDGYKVEIWYELPTSADPPESGAST